MNLKLRSSVSTIEREKNIIEFFKTNTREQVLIRSLSPVLKQFILSLDDTFTLEEYIKKENLEEYKEELIKFVEYLYSKGILSNIGLLDLKDYENNRRIIHFIEDYSTSDSHLKEMWLNLKHSKVVIIGLGAVGSWVALNLVQSGVQNIVLIDDDVIDVTNLHRQFGYCTNDIGELKGKVLAKKLKSFNSELEVQHISKVLDSNLLETLQLRDSDLIVNCADTPNVDTTSLWIGEYCMKYSIPHIVGGGYNMHLSLIGQTIIPFETACVKCFEIQLKEMNNIDPTSVKKLVVKNRKIGSFGPMCSIIASFIGMEAIKVLTKEITPANVNRRGEFNIYTMDVTYKEFLKLSDCPWCGGIF